MQKNQRNLEELSHQQEPWISSRSELDPNEKSDKTISKESISNDKDNGLQFVDINYVIISSSATCGRYDIELKGKVAKEVGLNKDSVIKTTKIYTGSHISM